MTQFQELHGHPVLEALRVMKPVAYELKVPYFFHPFKKSLPYLDLTIHEEGSENSWYYWIVVAFDGISPVAVDVELNADGIPVVNAENPQKMNREHLAGVLMLVLKDLGSGGQQVDLRRKRK